MEMNEKQARLLAMSYGNYRGAAANTYHNATAERLEHFIACVKQLRSDQEFLGIELMPFDEIDESLRWAKDLMDRDPPISP